jgi:hypothetical protein
MLGNDELRDQKQHRKEGADRPRYILVQNTSDRNTVSSLGREAASHAIEWSGLATRLTVAAFGPACTGLIGAAIGQQVRH